ncbi:MAG: hypothetical protein JSV58_02160 [Candidatus Bathyarchaeota archaeon]|nr:MAG: hypothetical protein JSV58_02160 [Candidatus Bathyarchaeota archaeon]
MDIFRDLLEVLSRVKRKGQTAKLCPRCGSSKLKITSGLDAYPHMLGITPLRYLCKNCGYHGSIVMEIEEEKTD